MSSQECNDGDNQGYPIKISQNIFKAWTGVPDVNPLIQKNLIPTDFSIAWGPATSSATISLTKNTSVFQISGIDSVTGNTTLNYGDAVYKCSNILSITQNLHKNFCQDINATFEATIAFQITNKSTNPGYPDIILMCRPLVFTTTTPDLFWTAVDKMSSSTSVTSNATAPFDLSKIYSYGDGNSKKSPTLMPMVSYQACLPIKILNYNNGPQRLVLRVNSIIQPLYVNSTENGLGKCTVVRQYTLMTHPYNLLDLFSGTPSVPGISPVIQFKDGKGVGGFPISITPPVANYTLMESPKTIGDIRSVLSTVEISVPEEFLGKTMSQITAAAAPPPAPKVNRQFKCYKINPDTDIVGNQILVDPKTGASLSDTMKEKAISEAGGDPSLVAAVLADGVVQSSGLMPGDIQQILSIALIVLGSIILLAYFGYVIHLFVVKKDVSNGLINGGIFAVLLAGLAVFGVFFG